MMILKLIMQCYALLHIESESTAAKQGLNLRRLLRHSINAWNGDGMHITEASTLARASLLPHRLLLPVMPVQRQL
jgi:hypothetical protein